MRYAGGFAAVAAVGMVLGAGTSRGQADEPRIRGAVARPPEEAVAGAPFDVGALFAAPPRDRNAAPVYLDALFEFSAEMRAAFPEGPETERRWKAATDRQQRFSAVFVAAEKDPKSVPGATIDALVALYGEGFRKLAEAQAREFCVFETGVGFTALLPHAQSARAVARVAVLKARRELETGDIDGAIGDAETVLRLARDLRPRGYIITELVSSAMVQVTARQIIPPILAAPGLAPVHCDRLLAALNAYEADGRDPFTESMKMEYVSVRVSLLDLIRHQEAFGKAMGVKPGDSVVKAFINPVLVAMAKPGQGQPQVKPNPDDTSGLPDDADAKLARTTPADLERAVGKLNAYYRGVLALKGLPRGEQAARLPALQRFLDGDDLLTRVIAGMQPAVGAFVPALGRCESTLRATECLTAVRRWQLTHGGASPDDLAAACRAAGLEGVPADPDNGKPLRLARVGGEAEIRAANDTFRLPPADPAAAPR